MKARDVIGKRIVAVEHKRFYNGHLKQHEIVVSAIVLDDGTVLVPLAFETEDCPEATIINAGRADLRQPSTSSQRKHS